MSDDYKIKFEIDSQETVEHVSQKPKDYEAATGSFLEALKGEGDIPGTPSSTSPSIAGGIDQLSAQEAFGPQEAARESLTDLDAEEADVAYQLKKFFPKSAGSTTAGASTAADLGPLTPSVNLLSTTLSNVSQSVATSFGKVATAAGPLGVAFLGLLTDLGLFGAAMLGLTGGLVAVTQIVDSLFRSLADNWREISPAMARAEGHSQMEIMATKLRTENKVSTDISEVTSARTDMQTTFIELSATVINLIGPALTALMETTSMALVAINGVLQAITTLAWPVHQMSKLLAGFIHQNVFGESEHGKYSGDPNKKPLPAWLFKGNLFAEQGLFRTKENEDKVEDRFWPQTKGPFKVDI